MGGLITASAAVADVAAGAYRWLLDGV